MGIRWYYMTPAEDAVEFTDGTAWWPLPALRSGAEEFAAEVSSIQVRDLDSTYDFLAWRRVYAVEEDAPTDETVIYMGFISDISIEKSTGRVPLDRTWTLTLTDLNYAVIPRVFEPDDFTRPEETDLERLTALLASDYIDHLDDNTDFQDTTGGVSLDARDFRQQSPYDVLHDMMEASNRNGFVFYDESEGPPDFGTAVRELPVWYAAVSADRYPSTIRISNDVADIDLDWTDPAAVTFAQVMPSKLHPDPQRIFSQGQADYQGGSVRVTDADIQTNYTRRDTSMSFPNVTSSVRAISRASRMLATGGTPAHRVEWGFVCTAAHVNKLMQGMKFEYKATHLGGLTDGPDYTDFVWLRAMNRQVEELAPGTYLVTGEGVPLSPPPGPCEDVNESAGTVTDGGGTHEWWDPENANDGNPATYTIRETFVTGAGTTTSILKTDLGAAFAVETFTIYGNTGGIDFNWTSGLKSRATVFQGSSDGSSWTSLAHSEVWDGEDTTVVTFDSPETWRYFRIHVSETMASGLGSFGEIKIYEWQVCGTP